MDPSVARRMWTLLEPIHAVIYFAPTFAPAFTELGLKGFWMGYFAERSAPMGAVSSGPVVATFYNFEPSMVEKAIPAAWELASPEAVLATRLDIVDSRLRECGVIDVAEVADAASVVADLCTINGRGLAAGESGTPVPDQPHLRLWRACTILREHRGDGHVAALQMADIDGAEAGVLQVAAGAVPEQQRDFRGWTEDQWSDATDRLSQRGLIAEGALTDEGRQLRDRVEAMTDELAVGPFAAAGQDHCDRLAAALGPLVEKIVSAGAVFYPNPVGVPKAKVDA